MNKLETLIYAAKMMFDDDAIIGPSRIVITGANKIEGISRLKFGGVVLSDQLKSLSHWEVIDGMVVIVPIKMNKTREHFWGHRIDQLMCQMENLTEEDQKRLEQENNDE